MSFMSALQFINGIFVFLGVPATIGGLIYIGRKLQILDSLSADMKIVKHNLKVVTDYLTRYHPEFDPKELKS